jgi:Glycosyltransferase 61
MSCILETMLFRLHLPWRSRSRSRSNGLSGFTDREYRYRSPLSLTQIPRASIFEGQEGVFIAPPGAVQQFTMRPVAFHDAPNDVQLFAALHDYTISYPPAFILSLLNVHLVGYRTILSPEGYFLDDQAYVEDEHLERRLRWLATSDPFLNENTGLVQHSEDRCFKLEQSGRAVVRLRGNIVVLCSHEPSVYGSFLFRVLPKLATLGRVPQGTKYLVYVGSDTMRQFLVMAGVPEDDIISHDPSSIYQIDHAIVPSLRNQQGLLDDLTLSYYADLRHRFGAKRRNRKIYVSRYNAVPTSSRVMVNEPELIEALRSIEFEIIAPQRMSARDQVQTFSAAEVVVGPAGSGMFNAVFCHPGTHLIDIESELHWIHAHRCLFGSLGLCYGIFEGRRVTDSPLPHQPFTVNIDALMNRIASIMGRHSI